MKEYKNLLICELINEEKKYLKNDEEVIEFIENEEKLKKIKIILSYEYIKTDLKNKLKKEEKKSSLRIKKTISKDIDILCDCFSKFTCIYASICFNLYPYKCKNIFYIQNHYNKKSLFVNDFCKNIKDFGVLRQLEMLNLNFIEKKRKVYYNLHCLKNLKVIIIKENEYFIKTPLSVKKQLRKLLKINDKLTIKINDKYYHNTKKYSYIHKL